MLTCHARISGTILRKALLLLVISFISIVNFAEARDFYFSTSFDDDSRTTAQVQNFATTGKTIDKLNSYFNCLLPGDSMLFKRGETAYGSILVSKSGSTAQNIIMSFYGIENKPVITAFQKVSEWSSIGAGVYESSANCLIIYYVNSQFGYSP